MGGFLKSLTRLADLLASHIRHFTDIRHELRGEHEAGEVSTEERESDGVLDFLDGDPEQGVSAAQMVIQKGERGS